MSYKELQAIKDVLEHKQGNYLDDEINALITGVEYLQSEIARLKAERDKAVELAVKVMRIFVIPRKDYDKYFRKLRIGAGVYMGTGYALMDAFYRVYDDFVDSGDDNLYRAVKRGLEAQNETE